MHSSQATVAELLVWMRDNMVKERPELFMRGNTVWVICMDPCTVVECMQMKVHAWLSNIEKPMVTTSALHMQQSCVSTQQYTYGTYPYDRQLFGLRRIQST